jgi:hypothetical protein
MICRIGGPDTAPLALALLAQRAWQGKGRGIAADTWDRKAGTGATPRTGFDDK